MQRPNLILASDGYKTSHHLQRPPNTKFNYSYVEARYSNRYPDIDKVTFFGLQYALLEYLSQRITLEDIEEAKSVIGSIFNESGWLTIVKRYNGCLPLTICAIPEGMIVPIGTPLVNVINADPEFAWLPSYFEPIITWATWYGTTVATLSRAIKEDLLAFHRRSSDAPESMVDFKLWDFGARGVSSYESGSLGGAAHLINFKGSDTLSAVKFAKDYYGTNVNELDFAIVPAAEHSTITAWGKEGEDAAIENMLDRFLKPGAVVSIVIDSYNPKRIIDLIGTKFHDRIVGSGGTVVLRPDSGDPTANVIDTTQSLMNYFGYRTNSKGYDVLPPYIKVLQGDGIDRDSIRVILKAMDANRMALDNVATFGMGGALLQKVDRDTFGFAMKSSAVLVDGYWRSVYKETPGKQSKRGMVEPWQLSNGEIVTADIFTADILDHRSAIVLPAHSKALFHTVFKNGLIVKEHTFDQIRQRAAIV